MKILKYKKGKRNEYQIITDKGEYVLFDDMIIKYELLLKKELKEQEWNKILKENQLLKAYYESLKAINKKLRTKKELKNILKKKNYQANEIEGALQRLEKEGYLNHKIYIEAYIHDAINLKIEGENKIGEDLEKLGFTYDEIHKELDKIDKNIYDEKIEKYLHKKLKGNKKSANEFKRKTLGELINKGFKREDIEKYLDKIEIKDNEEELKKIIAKLYNKYINKYDLYTTKLKIKNYLYTKGYQNIELEKYLKK